MTSGVKGSYKVYSCLYCSKEVRWGHSKINKFCDNICQGKYKWENETVPRILQGIGGDYKRYLRDISERLVVINVKNVVRKVCGIINR